MKLPRNTKVERWVVEGYPELTIVMGAPNEGYDWKDYELVSIYSGSRLVYSSGKKYAILNVFKRVRFYANDLREHDGLKRVDL